MPSITSRYQLYVKDETRYLLLFLIPNSRNKHVLSKSDLNLYTTWKRSNIHITVITSTCITVFRAKYKKRLTNMLCLKFLIDPQVNKSKSNTSYVYILFEIRCAVSVPYEKSGIQPDKKSIMQEDYVILYIILFETPFSFYCLTHVPDVIS